MDIREYIKENVLLFDGSMGTYFAEKFRDFSGSCESANLRASEKVREIHDEYIAAGCRAIKTNTFASNIFTCGGDEKMLADVISAGMRIAQEAAGEGGRTKSKAVENADSGKEEEIFVFADIGPVSGHDDESVQAAYVQLADLFIACGARHFLFETNAGAEHLLETARYIKKRVEDAFIIVSFSVQPDGYTREGSYVADLFRSVKECGDIDVFGLNCMSSAPHLYELIRKNDFSGKPISVMPNAGYPRIVGNRMFYDSDPVYFARILKDIAENGAAAVGGCCGTNPRFIEAAAAELEGLGDLPAKVKYAPGNIHSREKEDTAADAQKAKEEEALSRKREDGNSLWRKLSRGECPIAVELDPPRDADGAKFMQGAWQLKSAGADAITIADCPTARARMDSSLMACKIRREVGIDTVPHMTCRDRNLNATKALLLGLSMEGVHNVLTVTGDPVPTAERDEVKIVYQFNSRRLAKYIASLNETEFSQPFQIYGALNVNARRFDVQLDIAKKKIENGICGFLTQPVLTEEALENLKRAHEELDAKILGGIIPVVSSRNARFMNSEISGITVDDKITELYEGKTKEECTQIAIEVSTEIAKLIRPYIDGYYLMTPFYRTDIMVELIKNIDQLR